MVERLTPMNRYMLILFGSFMLWLVPVSIKAPRLITFISLCSSITGFGYCFVLADSIHQSGVIKSKRKSQQTDIDDYHLALEQEAIKKELFLQYFPPDPVPENTQPAQIAANAEQNAKDGLTEYLDLLIQHSMSLGWLTPTIVKRRDKKFRDFTPEQIREMFLQLEAIGMGECKGEADKLQWRVTGD